MKAAREAVIREQYHAAMRGVTSLKGRVEKLVEIRQCEGYMAEAHRDGAGYLFIENHCPICAAATACMNFCRSKLSIFRDVLGPEVEVSRSGPLLSGARRCAYRVMPRAAGAPREAAPREAGRRERAPHTAVVTPAGAARGPASRRARPRQDRPR